MRGAGKATSDQKFNDHGEYEFGSPRRGEDVFIYVDRVAWAPQQRSWGLFVEL